MRSLRRRALAGAACMALLTLPGLAQADLSFGELQDGLEWFLEQLMIEADLGTWVDQIGPLFDSIGTAVNSHLKDGFDPILFSDMPPVTVEQTIGYAQARSLDRLDRAIEAMGTASMIVDGIAGTAERLAGLDLDNLDPRSIFAALQVGNRTAMLTTESLSQLNALVAELGQVAVDQQVQEDYARRTAIAQAQAFYGPAGFTGGGVEPHTLNLAW